MVFVCRSGVRHEHGREQSVVKAHFELLIDYRLCFFTHSAREDEQVAAALGYTVHLLLLASKYLEVNCSSSSFSALFLQCRYRCFFLVCCFIF